MSPPDGRPQPTATPASAIRTVAHNKRPVANRISFEHYARSTRVSHSAIRTGAKSNCHAVARPHDCTTASPLNRAHDPTCFRVHRVLLVLLAIRPV
jgi:hypothetical protein